MAAEAVPAALEVAAGPHPGSGSGSLGVGSVEGSRRRRLRGRRPQGLVLDKVPSRGSRRRGGRGKEVGAAAGRGSDSGGSS